MPMSFDHTTLGQRVLFGTARAAAHLSYELARRPGARVMVLASHAEHGAVEQVCAEIDVTLWFDQVAPHVPVERARSARSAAAEHRIDLLVSVGGGSTTGLAKAVALTTGTPIIAVPTTYAGSEATNVWGLTDDRTKTAGLHDGVLPVTVIYDAALSTSLPVNQSVASGLNSLAHCVDSLWAPQADPINQALALEGARALTRALPVIVKDPGDLDAREQALYGCYLAAVAFASAGSGLHHKICHVLGGTFDLPHAQTHAIVLPYVLAFNAPAIPRLASRLAAALGNPPPSDHSLDAYGDRTDPAPEVVDALDRLRASVDAPCRLADYGLSDDDIPEAVRRAVAAAPMSNPVPVTPSGVAALLRGALTGAPPSVGPDPETQR